MTETYSPAETFALGEEIGKNASPGDIFTLDGDLGTGKTVIAQGIAKGLGIKDTVNSPTFTIMQVYDDGRLPLYHFDVYRISDPDEMLEIGFEEYLYGDGVTLVEWAELIDPLIPDCAHHIRIEKDNEISFDYRKITIT